MVSVDYIHLSQQKPLSSLSSNAADSYSVCTLNCSTHLVPKVGCCNASFIQRPHISQLSYCELCSYFQHITQICVILLCLHFDFPSFCFSPTLQKICPSVFLFYCPIMALTMAGASPHLHIDIKLHSRGRRTIGLKYSFNFLKVRTA